MAERHRAAIDVQSVLVQRQFAQARQHLRRKSFVELDQVDVVQRQAGQLQNFLNGRDRSDSESFRRHAGGRKAGESRQRLEAMLAANAADVTSTAAAPSLICDELPAVTVPLT